MTTSPEILFEGKISSLTFHFAPSPHCEFRLAGTDRTYFASGDFIIKLKIADVVYGRGRPADDGSMRVMDLAFARHGETISDSDKSRVRDSYECDLLYDFAAAKIAESAAKAEEDSEDLSILVSKLRDMRALGLGRSSHGLAFREAFEEETGKPDFYVVSLDRHQLADAVRPLSAAVAQSLLADELRRQNPEVVRVMAAQGIPKEPIKIVVVAGGQVRVYPAPKPRKP